METKVQHKYTMKYYAAVKKSEICREMGGPGEDYREGGNPDPGNPNTTCPLSPATPGSESSDVSV